MNSILRTTLIFAFIVCLSGMYISNTLWAHGGGRVDDEFDEHTGPANAKRIAKIIDRVCSKQIDKDGAKKYKKDGHKYYFCSKKCKKTFKKNPEKYACICPALFDECPCFHCKGTGELCDCAERTVYMESHSGTH